MTYEEKYKQALERAKIGLQECNLKDCDNNVRRTAITLIHNLFPELKESEDERIGKMLRAYIHDFGVPKEYFGDVETSDVLAWLEKQGEQSTDKVEPKFKVGDWIVGDEGIFKISQYEDDYGYNLTDITGCVVHFVSPNHVESNYHLWTIQDAKDGDVLVNGSNIFIFHFINDTRLMGYCHVNIDDGRFYDDIGKNECFCLIDAVVTPATKEQRELLFAKMREAGYEWDAEKNELKKIGVKTLNADEVIEWIDRNDSMFWDSPCNPKNIIKRFKKDFGL